MKLYSKIRKAIVGEDFSKGIISGLVRKKSGERLECNHSNGEKLLYVGSGEGLFLIPSAKKYSDSQHTGIDNNERILAFIKQRVVMEGLSNVSFKLTEGRSLPFEDNCFDQVFCLNAVHNQTNVEEVKNIMIELIRVCAPGGKIYFDIRNKNNVIFYLVYKLFLKMDSTKPKIIMLNKKFVNGVLGELEFNKVKFYALNIFKVGYLIEITK